jgi:hypothetical protein
MATSTRIIAYSTSPCPCSLADNNIMSSFLNIYSASKNRKDKIILSFCSHFVLKNSAFCIPK